MYICNMYSFSETFTKIVLHIKKEQKTVVAVTLPDLPTTNLTFQMSRHSVRRAMDYNFVTPDPTTLINMKDLTSIFMKKPVLLIDQANFEASVNEALKLRGGAQFSVLKCVTLRYIYIILHCIIY